MSTHRNEAGHTFVIPLLASCIGAKRYLELGVCDNESIRRMPQAVGPGGLVIGVDIKAPPYQVPGVTYRFMTTAEYLANYAAADGPFDIAFIDADHNEAAVLADFHGVWPHIVDDGLILLHDGNPAREGDVAPGFCNDAWKAIRTITESHEAVTLPYHPGLTIVRKRVRWGPLPGPREE